jgi:hypothetical protein
MHWGCALLLALSLPGILVRMLASVHDIQKYINVKRLGTRVLVLRCARFCRHPIRGMAGSADCTQTWLGSDLQAQQSQW